MRACGEVGADLPRAVLVIHFHWAQASAMRKSLRAVGFMTASLSLASGAFAAPAPSGGWTPQMDTDAPSQVVEKLNPTGRTYEIEVPLKSDGTRLGDVGIKITADDKLFVDAKLMKTYLGKIYRPEVLTAALSAPEDQAVEAPGGSVVGKKAPGAPGSIVQLASQQMETTEPEDLGGGKPSYLSVAKLKERGIDARYDSLNLDLEVFPTVDQRPTGLISFAQDAEGESATLEEPAYVSAYVNIHLGASYVSQSVSGAGGAEPPTLDFDGAVRVGPYVLEAEGTFYSPTAQWFSPSYFQDYVFYRRGTRLVYDMPDEAIRLRVGDVGPNYTGFQTAPDLLGISADVAYAQLQPQKSIRPTGAHSFRVERPSNVDILVDGALIKRIRLGPGNYNLTDLPLNPGANDVKLNIEDDTGQRQTLQFTGFSGQDLLSPGISEWSVSAGVKSYDIGAGEAGSSAALPGPVNTIVGKNAPNSFYAQRQYFFDQPAATGFYRIGLLDWVTGESNFQTDMNVAMAGVGVATETIDGLFTAKLAASDAYDGVSGGALQLAYDYDKLNWFGYRASIRLLSEYRTHGFETVGTYTNPVNYTAYLAATYAQHLPWSLTGGLSFSYYFADHASASDAGDRWQADASLSMPLFDSVSGSVSFSYGQDQTADATACCAYNQNGFQAFLRLAWTPDAHSNASASYDSRSQAVQTAYTQSGEATGVGSWNATAIAETGGNGETTASASASYFANRAEFYVGHEAAFSGLGYGEPFNPYSTQEQTSIGVGTSLVYADGAWGLGRRVTSGFALIAAHESLEGSPVVVGGAELIVAETDWLGPAVTPTSSPYRQTRITYDAPDAPAGYNLGSAAFDMKAPYKAGYNLKAGSAYTVTAMGTLLDAEGQPLPLLAGEAHEANKENGRKVGLFTNRAGTFGAQGLAPGKWIIEMPTEPGPSRYVFEIPEGVVGLYNAGALKQEGGVQQKPPIVEAEADNGTN